jgi:hypothetical protein
MEEKKISVNDLYNHIIQFMTPEVALKKLLSSSLIQYEKLKFDKDDQPVHPEFIIAMAALDLGWMIGVTDDDPVIGLIVGNEKFVEKLNKKTNTVVIN